MIIRQLKRKFPCLSQLPHRFCCSFIKTLLIGTPSFEAYIVTLSGIFFSAWFLYHSTRATRTADTKSDLSMLAGRVTTRYLPETLQVPIWQSLSFLTFNSRCRPRYEKVSPLTYSRGTGKLSNSE